MTADDLSTETEDLSVRDALASAFAESETPSTPAASEAAAPGSNPPQAADPAQSQSNRDEHGRFAKAPAAPKPTPEPGAPQAGTEAQEAAPIPPASWSATAKAQFATLPKDIQQEVLKREEDMNKGQAQWQTKGERLNRLDEILAPRRERMQLAGIDDIQAIRSLFAAQDFLERDPVNALLYLARQAGVHPQTLAQAIGGGAQQQRAPLDPTLQAIFGEINTLKSAHAQQQQAAQQASQAQYVDQISAFAANPKNLYFENVKGDMATLLSAGRAKTLEEAYEQATWASPEIRALLIQDQRKQEAEAAEQARRAKAGAARQASGSVTGSPVAGSSPANGGPAPSLNEELRRAFAEAS